MEPRIRYAKTKDRVSIAFAVLGEGPPIVVVPSLFSNVRLLMSGGAGDSSPNASIGVVHLLAKLGRMVVTFDSRCMGSSDRAIPDCSLEGRVADLDAVVDELALERFDLHGGIHGAATATVYAAHHPERVSHLALVNPYTRGEDYYARTPTTRAIKALARSQKMPGSSSH